MKKINFLIQIILILLGIFWISLFIYRYVLNNPSLLLYITNNIQIIRLFLIISITINLFLLNRNLKLIQNAFIINLVTKYNQVIDTIYWKPLFAVFDKLFKPIPYTGDILMWIAKIIIKYKNHPKIILILKTICLLTDIFPRVILACLFGYDVLFNNQIYYFKLVLPFLLCYHIVCQLILFILKDFSLLNKTILETYLDIVRTKNNAKIEETFTLKPEKLINHKHKFKLYVTRYLLFQDLYKMSVVYYIFREKMNHPALKNFLIFIYLIAMIKLLFML